MMHAQRSSGNCQSKTQASGSLVMRSVGAKKWIEDTVLYGFGDPKSVVANRNLRGLCPSLDPYLDRRAWG